MPPRRPPRALNVEILKLQRRRTELDNAIRLLEELRLIRLRRPLPLATITSKLRRRAY